MSLYVCRDEDGTRLEKIVVRAVGDVICIVISRNVMKLEHMFGTPLSIYFYPTARTSPVSITYQTSRSSFSMFTAWRIRAFLKRTSLFFFTVCF